MNLSLNRGQYIPQLGTNDRGQHSEDKVLVVGREPEALASNAVITVSRDKLEMVLKYLGSIFTPDSILDAEIIHRTATVDVAFLQLQMV